MTKEQIQFLKDLVESLNKREPMSYADQTRTAELIKNAFPEVFSTRCGGQQILNIAPCIPDVGGACRSDSNQEIT